MIIPSAVSNIVYLLDFATTWTWSLRPLAFTENERSSLVNQPPLTFILAKDLLKEISLGASEAAFQTWSQVALEVWPLIDLCWTVVWQLSVALYNIPQNTKAQAGNNLGIYIYGDNETYDQAGLDTFFASSATNIPAGTSPAVNSTEISTYPSIVSDELMLDLEVAYPLVYPQNISILEFAPTYQTSIKASDVNVNVTKVFSISYAGLEDLSNTEQKRQCNELMKLGLQGVSVLVSSGDDGVGSNCGGTFQVKYPSSCPYVTSVGGTMVRRPSSWNHIWL